MQIDRYAVPVGCDAVLLLHQALCRVGPSRDELGVAFAPGLVKNGVVGVFQLQPWFHGRGGGEDDRDEPETADTRCADHVVSRTLRILKSLLKNASERGIDTTAIPYYYLGHAWRRRAARF